jgi:hypothetical protein
VDLQWSAVTRRGITPFSFYLLMYNWPSPLCLLYRITLEKLAKMQIPLIRLQCGKTALRLMKNASLLT